MRLPTVLLASLLAAAGASAPAAGVPSGRDASELRQNLDTGPGEFLQTFFCLVNKTGQRVKVRVQADGRELFVQEIPGELEGAPGPKSVPPPEGFPAREVKTALPRQARCLEVEEVRSGTKASFKVTGFSRVEAGFRIVLEEKRIVLHQDYYPVRAAPRSR